MLRQRENIVIVITVAMILIVVAALLGVYADYTDGFKQDFTGLYLTAGDTAFYTDGNAVLGNVEFKVHNAWDLNSHYTVKVLPAGDDFVYRVGEDSKMYSFLTDVDDLSAALDLKVKGSKFSIKCLDVTMQDVLQRYYGEEVDIPSDENNRIHFKLVVTLDTGWVSTQSIEVSFRCSSKVSGVEIDPPRVVF